jgi:opacity protein-like surface antigen
MRRSLVLAAALAVVLTASHATAWSSPSRFALGLDAQGAQWSGGPSATSFLPGLAGTYNLTSGFTLGAHLQREFPRHTTLGALGLRFRILSVDRGGIWLGADLVGYGERTAWLGIVKPTSWRSVVNGSYDLVQKQDNLILNKKRTVLYGIAGASYDQDNNVKQVHIGLRYALLGGHPQ